MASISAGNLVTICNTESEIGNGSYSLLSKMSQSLTYFVLAAEDKRFIKLGDQEVPKPRVGHAELDGRKQKLLLRK